jgi:SM-20-related protein
MTESAQGMLIRRVDNVVREDQRKLLYDFLSRPGWKFGWKSNPDNGVYAFWHKHFAGAIHAGDPEHGINDVPYDCSQELQRTAPLLHTFWLGLANTVLKGHRILRCYANGLAYGSDGTLHTDAVAPGNFTTIYYPNERWDPNWGGETVFFDQSESDIVAAIYPKPNRLITFPGMVPHVARGVSRQCPDLRITLMFKTEISPVP